MDFLGAARRTIGIPEGAALICYTVLISWLVHIHQPWADEAQAWDLARESSLSGLILRRLHYEGSPGLWHSLLWVLARLHFSYEGMHWIAAVFGVVAAWQILFCSPFHRFIRILLPFTFFFVFQTAIIARSYCLVPMLVFLLCIEITRKQRPLVFMLVAGLLANTALVAAVMSAGFVVLWVTQKRMWLDKPPERLPGKRTAGRTAAAILLALWAIAFYTAIPAPDAEFGRVATLVEHPAIRMMLSRATGINASSTAGASGEPKTEAIPKPPHLNRIEGRIWEKTMERGHRTIPDKILSTAISLLSLSFYCVSTFNLLALLFYIALVVWLYRTKGMPFLIPALFVLLGGYGLGGLAPRHMVLLWTALVATLWLAWERNFASTPGKSHRVLLWILGVVIAEQIGWTAAAVYSESHEPFDGGRQAAQFLNQYTGGEPIAGFGYHSASVQPYFPSSRFINSETSYWPWRLGRDPDDKLHWVLQQRPPFILVGESLSGNVNVENQLFTRIEPGTPEASEVVSLLKYLDEHGYREAQRFCGREPAQFGYSLETCQLILQRIPGAMDSDSPRHSLK